MTKVDLKSFQPTQVTEMIIDVTCNKDKGGISMSKFINNAIISYCTPYNEALRKETECIFQQIVNEEQISPEELKATLARCVDILKDYPISDAKPLEQIFIHFTNRCGRNLRYDYIKIVDEQQDRILHRLNDIIATVDEDFTYGSREFGERSRYIFEHWNELCSYSEIYTSLATLIECEDIYYPLSVFRTIDLIKLLDLAVRDSSLEAIKTPFETNISLTKRYSGISYECSVYLTENAYVALSGDKNFDHMPDEIRAYYQAYYQKYMGKGTIYGDATEEDVKEMAAIEREGRMLLEDLIIQKKIEKLPVKE